MLALSPLIVADLSLRTRAPYPLWPPIPALIAASRHLGAALAEPGSFSALLLGALLVLHAAYFAAIYLVRRTTATLSLAGLLLWTLAVALPLLLLPPRPYNDIYSYIVYGRIVSVYDASSYVSLPAHFPADPYLIYIDVPWRNVFSVYGPLWVLFAHGLTALVELGGGGLPLYLLGYKVCALASHLLSIALIWSILGRWKPRQQLLGALIYAWNPLALYEFAANAHNDTFMIAFFLLALWLHLRRRYLGALLALLGAILIKWVVVILVPLYALLLLRELASPRAFLRWAALGGVLAALLTTAAFLPYWAGAQTLRIFEDAPSLTRSTNSLGDLLINELVALQPPPSAPSRYDRLSGLPKQLPVGREGTSDDEVVDLFAAEQRSEARSPEEFISLALEQRRRSFVPAFQLVGNAILLAGLLWWCRHMRTFELMVRGWTWILFLYLVFTSIWFFQWYIPWFVALAVLTDWRRGMVVALILSTTVWVTTLAVTPSWITTYRSVIAFGPALAYLLASYLVPRLRPPSRPLSTPPAAPPQEQAPGL